jgi:murein DD-endopeptidase MepM/ murein hydrolase activator NlpD
MPPVITPQVAPLPGVYHLVEKGQTLWRIAKTYDVDLEELARINRITDTSSIEVGQILLIPNRKTQRIVPIAGLYDDFIWPLKGRVISGFGSTSNNMINKGLDIVPDGNRDVVAARSGRVSFLADNFGSFGKTIIIDHGDGFSTVYARNAECFVKAGDTIQKGALISKAGYAGRDKNTYLHFEIRKGHIAQNPYYYLP